MHIHKFHDNCIRRRRRRHAGPKRRYMILGVQYVPPPLARTTPLSEQPQVLLLQLLEPCLCLLMNTLPP